MALVLAAGAGAPARAYPIILPIAGNVEEFEITPDGVHVVYRADGDTLHLAEMYAVPAEGGTPRKLNPAPVGGWATGIWTLSADGFFDLFSVPIDASSAPVALNGREHPLRHQPRQRADPV